MTAKLLCHTVNERINTITHDKYTNLSIEHRQRKYWENTAPFQVYFQTPREGNRKVCKLILNITYIYDPAGRLDMLRACSNGPDLHQDTLVCALEPRSLSCLGQITSVIVLGSHFVHYSGVYTLYIWLYMAICSHIYTLLTIHMHCINIYRS